MGIATNQYDHYVNANGDDDDRYTGITTGIIVDTNDPTDSGRMRIVVPRYGDVLNAPLEDIPWTIMSSPSLGTRSVGTRGPGIQTSEGPVAYGFWSPPTVGATAIVMCIDGNYNYRVFLGCIPKPFTMHTMPHGRWIHEDHPKLPDGGVGLSGPLTSREQPLQPLYDNINIAFGSNPKSKQRLTRAADYSIAAVDVSQLDMTISEVPDDKEYVANNWTQINGYGISRIDPTAPTTVTSRNRDNQVHAWTTPGMHAISMDDRQENCRVKIRTTSGMQILMDDTNERFYLSLAKGKVWIEFDEAGVGDMYFANGLNISSGSSINFTAAAAINMFAGTGINLTAGTDIKATAGGGVDLKIGADLQATAGGSILMGAGGEIGLTSGGNMNVTGGGTMNLLGSSIIASGGVIHLNGPEASAATVAAPNAADFPSRIPQHEPWSRSDNVGPDSMEQQYGADDPGSGRVVNGTTIARGYYWRP